MKIGRLQETVTIPEDIELSLDGTTIRVKGKLGNMERNFGDSKIEMVRKKDAIVLSSYFPNRKEKALLGTVKAHINNLITGTTHGYQYFLKIVYSHFPIRVSVENRKNRVKIDNLYGGRKPLYAKILPGVKVVLADDDVIVTGINKEAVGQTAANIQEKTRQRGKRRKSPKTFQDGIYLYQKRLQSD